MTHMQAVLIALVALLGLAAAAEASVDLWTPPLFVDAGAKVECKLTNITTVNRTVEIRIYDENGVVQATLPPYSAPPFSAAVADSPVGPHLYTCRFTVPSRTVVRAGAALFTTTGSLVDRVEVLAQ